MTPLLLLSHPLKGYNIVNFDLPYLLNRADTLKIPQFWTWGRIRNRWARLGGARAVETAMLYGAAHCTRSCCCRDAPGVREPDVNLPLTSTCPLDANPPPTPSCPAPHPHTHAQAVQDA